MTKFLPFQLREPIGPNNSVDPIDTVIAKRSLSRLGYFNEAKSGLTPFPDKKLFSGIKKFQADQRLRIDGVIKPKGPTVQKIASLLLSATEPHKEILQANPLAVGNSSATAEQCDHLFYQVDVPVSRAIQRRRGKRAAANCYHSAAARYAACLQGVPINALPPLNTWNQ